MNWLTGVWPCMLMQYVIPAKSKDERVHDYVFARVMQSMLDALSPSITRATAVFCQEQSTAYCCCCSSIVSIDNLVTSRVSPWIQGVPSRWNPLSHRLNLSVI